MNPDISNSPRPTFLRGLLFRFAFAYWGLFCITLFAHEDDPFGWFGRAPDTCWEPIVRWVGAHVLGISSELNNTYNGSGDRLYDWVSLFCVAIVAALVAGAWAILDRRRAHDRRLRVILRTVVRYTLAFVILEYGVAKFVQAQFPPPTGGQLLQRYGDSSPMGLLWTFMGSSQTYVYFSGVGEVLGAVLLLSRRTTTLGALILAAVLTNIVMLNLCYDVCVKINSMHYLAMCIFLALPDLRRLANVLVLNRAVAPAPTPPPLSRRWMRIARLVAKYGLVTYTVLAIVTELRVDAGHSRVATWYDGYWNVTTLSRNSQDVPALITDKTRWRRIKFEAYPDTIYVRWRFMDDSLGGLYEVALDEKLHTMTLTPDRRDAPAHPGPPIVFSYARRDATHWSFAGKVGDDALVVELERFDPGDMLLVTRGFHWVSEEPFNR